MIIIGIVVLLHLVITGFGYRRAEARWRKRTNCHRDGRICRGPVGSGVCGYHGGVQTIWFALGFIWPIYLPVGIGVTLSDLQGSGDSREERRHQRNKKRAENMAELAEIHLREAVALQQAADIQGENNILNLALNRK